MAVYQSTSLPEYQSTSLPVYQSTSLPVYQSTSLPVVMCTMCIVQCHSRPTTNWLPPDLELKPVSVVLNYPGGIHTSLARPVYHVPATSQHSLADGQLVMAVTMVDKQLYS